MPKNQMNIYCDTSSWACNKCKKIIDKTVSKSYALKIRRRRR